MILNLFIKVGLSFLLISQQAFAVDTSFAEKTSYLRASAIFKEMISNQGPFDFKNLTKEDKALIELAHKNKNPDVKVEFSASGILIYSKDMAMSMEWKNNELYLGGIKHKLNTKISIAENIRNWAKIYVKNQNSKSAGLYSLAVSQAQAADVEFTGTNAASSINKVPSYGEKVLNYAKAVASGAGAVGGNAAIGAVGGAAALYTGIMVGAVTSLAVLTCEAMARTNSFGNSVNRERLNCYSASLSFFDLNPRDELYVQDIKCNEGQISVELESQRNIKSTRTFNFQGDALVSAEDNKRLGRYSDKREKSSVQFSKPPTPEQVEILKMLEPELNQYRSLCKNTELLAKFKAEAAKAHSEKEIITTKPAGTK